MGSYSIGESLCLIYFCFGRPKRIYIWQNLIPQLKEKIENFKPSLIRRVAKDATLEAIKAFCEANGVLDTAAYPPHLPELVPLVSDDRQHLQ
jgi:hypothetical protein